MNSKTHDISTIPQFLNPFIGIVSKYLIIPIFSIFVLWTVALHIGMTSQIGYASGFSVFRSPMTIFGPLDMRLPLGSLVFYASSGDMVSVDYSLNDEADGSLLFSLSQISSLAFKSSDHEDVFGKRHGTINLDVNSSGFYMLRIIPTGAGKKSGSKSGFNLSWSASWKLIR